MKKIKIILFIITGIAMASCDSNTYDEVSVITTNPTYLANVKPIISSNCTSCHSVDGGQEPYLETYDQVKNAVLNNGLVDEISATTGQGMPEAGRMSQSKINLITTWVNNGFPN